MAKNKMNYLVAANKSLREAEQNEKEARSLRAKAAKEKTKKLRDKWSRDAVVFEEGAIALRKRYSELIGKAGREVLNAS